MTQSQSRPKRVLYIAPNSKLGGAEQCVLLLGRHHDRTRWTPLIYCLSDGPLVSELRAAGVTCYVPDLARPRLKDPASVFRTVLDIVRVIRREQIDLVHSVMGYAHLFGGIASKIASVPELWFQHGPTDTIDWLTARVPTDLLVVNSQYTLEKQRRFHAWAKKITTIHPGTEARRPDDVTSQSEVASALRIKYGIRSDETVFTLMARISPMKGHLLFLQAAADLKKQSVMAKFLIAGETFLPSDQSYELEVKKAVTDLGLDEDVIFTGFVRESQTATLLASDCIVNASIIDEPFGLTLIEGMMLGRPVIAPRAGGPLEIIENEKNGLFFTPRDPRSLADKMKQIALGPDLRTTLGQYAKISAQHRFGIEKMTTDLESEYDLLTHSL